MARITQEFYCRSSGGGCGGYFLAKLDFALTGVHNIVCPECKHKHQRRIENGKIVGENRHSGNPVDEIYPTKASYSRTPRTLAMNKHVGSNNDCDSIVINSAKDAPDISHWIEVFGGKR